jgi:ATP-dependent helicase HrpA
VEQLSALLPKHFAIETPWEWLVHVPRYLAAIAYRIDKLTSGGQGRDQANLLEMERLWSQYLERARLSTNSKYNDELATYRWMLEEYRVSLFAQPLGTAIKISPQRLQKQWNKVDASEHGR